MLAEPQHDAEFFRLHAEKSGQPPDRQCADQQQRDAHAAEIAAGQYLLQLVLAAAQQVFQIRRPRSDRLRAGAPRSLGSRAPRASALILPRHRQISSAGLGGSPGLANAAWPYRGPPRRLQRGLLPAGAMPDPIIVNVNID